MSLGLYWAVLFSSQVLSPIGFGGINLQCWEFSVTHFVKGWVNTWETWLGIGLVSNSDILFVYPLLSFPLGLLLLRGSTKTGLDAALSAPHALPLSWSSFIFLDRFKTMANILTHWLWISFEVLTDQSFLSKHILFWTQCGLMNILALGCYFLHLCKTFFVAGVPRVMPRWYLMLSRMSCLHLHMCCCWYATQPSWALRLLLGTLCKSLQSVLEVVVRLNLLNNDPAIFGVETLICLLSGALCSIAANNSTQLTLVEDLLLALRPWLWLATFLGASSSGRRLLSHAIGVLIDRE